MARARSGMGGRHYKTTEQKAYEQQVILAWRAAGSLRLPDGPWALGVVAYMARPANHWRADGELSAVGKREPYPMRKPDIDNMVKQIDVLVASRAVPDDSYLVKLQADKVWAPRGRQRLVFVLRTLVPEEVADSG
jgi:Holliday junction resolvase RusA-like endonuclease